MVCLPPFSTGNSDFFHSFQVLSCIRAQLPIPQWLVPVELVKRFLAGPGDAENGGLSWSFHSFHDGKTMEKYGNMRFHEVSWCLDIIKYMILRKIEAPHLWWKFLGSEVPALLKGGLLWRLLCATCRWSPKATGEIMALEEKAPVINIGYPWIPQTWKNIWELYENMISVWIWQKSSAKSCVLTHGRPQIMPKSFMGQSLLSQGR